MTSHQINSFSDANSMRKAVEHFMRTLRFDMDKHSKHASFLFSQKNEQGETVHVPPAQYRKHVYILFERILLRLQPGKWQKQEDLTSIGWFQPFYLEARTQKLWITMKIYKVEYGYKIYFEWTGPGWAEQTGEVELTLKQLPCLSGIPVRGWQAFEMDSEKK